MCQWSFFFTLSWILLSCSSVHTTRTHEVERAYSTLPPPTAQPFLPKRTLKGLGAISGIYAPSEKLVTETAAWEESSNGQSHVYKAGDNNYHITFGGTGASGSVMGYGMFDYLLQVNCVRLSEVWVGKVSTGLRLQRDFSGLILGGGILVGGFRALVDVSDNEIIVDSVFDSSTMLDLVRVDTSYDTHSSSGRQDGFFYGISLGGSVPGNRFTPFVVWTLEVPREHFHALPYETYGIIQQSLLGGWEYQWQESWFFQFAAELQAISTRYEAGTGSTLGVRAGLTYR